MTVWVDAWQMQCCGEPFSIGSEVTWTLQPTTDRDFAATVLGDQLASTLTHDEEHHGGLPEDAPVTTGIVRSIRAASCAYSPTAGSSNLYPVAGSLVLTDKTSAGWESEPEGLMFVAYVVELQPSG
jgi:hypothetical protein